MRTPRSQTPSRRRKSSPGSSVGMRTFPATSPRCTSFPGRQEGRFADPDKRFLWRDGEIVFAFSEHRGKTLEEVAEKHPGFLDWMISKSFSEEAKRIVRDARRGIFPKKA